MLALILAILILLVVMSNLRESARPSTSTERKIISETQVLLYVLASNSMAGTNTSITSVLWQTELHRHITRADTAIVDTSWSNVSGESMTSQPAASTLDD